MISTRYYRISELSRLTKVPVPTIRFYLREGLLPPAIKTAKTMAFYTGDHLKRLIIIKKMQQHEGKTIAQIRDAIGTMPAPASIPADEIITSSEKRDEIITSAIKLFIEKGLGKTSMDDIAAEAHIGKGTLYRYFKDKNELFIECADTIFYEMYRNIWEEIKNEKDMARRLQKRLSAFFDSYPKWIDMMNLVRYASVGENPRLKNKFRAVLDQIIKPIAHDLEVLKREGRLRSEVNCLEAGYFFMGAAEYSAALLQSGKLSIDEILSVFHVLLTRGLRK
ncbi:MAG: MerR family transcriptional regulator [Deltaproteobacteria bacterium]|nr:MAG: MerR family transcriptional regulator [Deltaproteobacteria bacterium]